MFSNEAKMTEKVSFLYDAEQFAKARHAAIGQVRKYTLEPYYNHPVRVAKTVQKAWVMAKNGYIRDPEEEARLKELLAASLTHDLVEDTPTKLEEIRERFGDAVGDLVDWVTDKFIGEKLPRVERSKKETERLSEAPMLARIIKLADLLDNCPSIAEHDSSFSKVYFKEKRALIKAFEDNPPDSEGEKEVFLLMYEDLMLEAKMLLG